MYNKFEIRLSYWKLQEFYNKLKGVRFNYITEDRFEYLDNLVNEYKLYFSIDTTSMGSLATSAAEKLTKDHSKYGFLNRDEIIYFYIKMVDPEFKFLEVYESVATIKEMRETCILNFGYYDNVIIFFERIFNKKFQIFEPDELWMRDSIKRTRKMFD